MAKEAKPCPTCGGSGEVEVKKDRHIESVRVCPTCKGTGEKR